MPPSPLTNYEILDGQVVVPPDASDRSAIQPVSATQANGGNGQIFRLVNPKPPINLTGPAPVSRLSGLLHKEKGMIKLPSAVSVIWTGSGSS